MKNLNLIISLLFIGNLVCACQTESEKSWLKKNTHDLLNENSYNFTALAEVIGEKKIVAIGESSHGIGDYYTLKSALVKYLHEEKGFEVLAMEGGFGDINLAYSNIDSLSAKSLRNNTVFGNFRAKEAEMLFQHIKTSSITERPLFYTGYDSQTSSQYFIHKLKQILKKYDPEFVEHIDNDFQSYYLSYQATQKGDSIAYFTHRDRFIQASKKAKNLLELNQKEILLHKTIHKDDLAIMIKTLVGFYASVDLSWQNRWNLIPLRDSIMFENLKWLIKVKYPDKKVIIWAHNGHIAKDEVEGSNSKMMGHYLKDYFKDDYYAIGLFSTIGESYQHWTKKVIAFDNTDSTFIEKRMYDTEKRTAFINLQKVKNNSYSNWLYKPIHGFEVENMGKISFIPMKRYDGLINISQSKAPTYE